MKEFSYFANKLIRCPVVAITIPTLTSNVISDTPSPTPSDTPVSESSAAPPTTSNTPAPPSSIPSDQPPSTSEEPSLITSIVTQSQTPGQSTPVVVTVTRTNSRPTQPAPTRVTTTTSSSATSASGSALPASETPPPPSGLKDGERIAVAVVVPLVAVALLVLGGLFLWRRRKQRKDAEEARKKEMEEYNYNPNNDTTMPAVAGMSPNGDDSTLKDSDQGYRGWGTTSTARKGSTTMGSSNPGGMARSDSGGNGYTGPHSPTAAAPVSDNHSGDPLVDEHSPDSEGIGALGVAPVVTNRSQGGVNRGPSNASSAYSGANRSDASGDGAPANHMGSPQYYNDLMHHDESGHNAPHADGSWGGQPVIREVQARRNTKIENPSVFPQQGNSGIAQNF